MQEGQTGNIDLPEDDPSIIARLLLYIYTGNYPTAKLNPQLSGQAQFHSIIDTHHDPEEEDDFSWMARAKLHVLTTEAAVKYDIHNLFKHAARRFLKAYHGEDESDFFGNLESYDDDDKMELDEDMAEMGRFICSNSLASDRLPRLALIDTCVISRGRLDEPGPMLSLYKSVPELSIDVASSQFRKIQWKCMVCQKAEVLLEFPCADGYFNCKKEGCVKHYEKNIWCPSCLQIGTMRAEDSND
jgi:hypothetical protein